MVLDDITFRHRDVTSSMVPCYSTGVPQAGSSKKKQCDEMVIDFYETIVGLVIQNGIMALEEHRERFLVAAVLKGYLVLFCRPMLSKLLSR